MNLTGNILSIYTTFQNMLAAYNICDYYTMATQVGVITKKLYSVQPIQQESLLVIPGYEIADTHF